MFVAAGCLFGVSGPEQVLIIDNAEGGELLGASGAQVAFNLGNAVGRLARRFADCCRLFLPLCRSAGGFAGDGRTVYDPAFPPFDKRKRRKLNKTKKSRCENGFFPERRRKPYFTGSPHWLALVSPGMQNQIRSAMPPMKGTRLIKSQNQGLPRS